MFGQEAGTKAFCIDQLKGIGFDDSNVLMVGDAPGDLEAAQNNGVLFYPILAGREKFSWDRFRNEAFGKFLDGNFRGEYQEKLITEFTNNLK